MKSLNYIYLLFNLQLTESVAGKGEGKRGKKHSLIVPFETPKQPAFKCMQSDTLKMIILFFAVVYRTLLRHTH